MQRTSQDGMLDDPVTDDAERGRAIQERRKAQGITSRREFAVRTGIARDTIRKAELGRASERSYARLEAWLDLFEHEVGEDEPTASNIEQMEFVVDGEDVTVTVKGPVADAPALEQSVARIIRMIREGSPDKPLN